MGRRLASPDARSLASVGQQQVDFLPGLLLIRPEPVPPCTGPTAEEAAARRSARRAPVLVRQTPFGDEIPVPSDQKLAALMAERASRGGIEQVIGVHVAQAIGPGDLTCPSHFRG